VRLTLFWNSVASGARPANPALHTSGEYNWSWFDQQVQLAKQNGLDVYAEIIFAPTWAADDTAGIRNPSPDELRLFAQAAATRYSGGAHPKIRYWQVWGEPNRHYFLSPQYDSSGRIVAAEHYRKMVNAVAQGVKLADPNNRVIAGVLSPLKRASSPAPLAFMRTMLCLDRQLRRTCLDPVQFDVWAHQAYTYGGPTKRSAAADDVQLGDLGKLRRVLAAARKAGNVVAPNGVDFWVTEWSWDTRPPDRRGLPAAIHARWVADSIYRMWRNGVTVATWWRVRDEPMHVSRYQSGFFTTRWGAKRSLAAFRFPFVAFRAPGGITVWGRTPGSRPGPVVLHVKRGARWVRIGRLPANADGIFRGKVRLANRTGAVRATWRRSRSVPFALVPPRAPRNIDPFGCPASGC
jgi:hypothetical protein